MRDIRWNCQLDFELDDMGGHDGLALTAEGFLYRPSWAINMF